MEGQPLTADALKAYSQNGGYVLYTIGDLFNDYMHILSKRVRKDLTARSYRKYEIARDKFYQVISPKEPVSAITKTVILVVLCPRSFATTSKRIPLLKHLVA